MSFGATDGLALLAVAAFMYINVDGDEKTAVNMLVMTNSDTLK
jgi:stage V sporulation protein SpoVS